MEAREAVACLLEVDPAPSQYPRGRVGERDRDSRINAGADCGVSRRHCRDEAVQFLGAVLIPAVLGHGFNGFIRTIATTPKMIHQIVS